MEKIRKFDNLGASACHVIYAANGVLLVGFLVLFVFALPIGLLTFLYALQAAGKGYFGGLAALLAVFLWFFAGFACFIAVIIIAALKKRWNWILQFLPFVMAVVFYSILIIANHF